MEKLESPRDFTKRLVRGVHDYDGEPELCAQVAIITARDRAVRTAALEEAAAHLERNAKAQRNSAFPHTAEFAQRVAAYFRALATKEPDDE